MNIKMPVGISDFKTARERYYLVDKTPFIRELIENHKAVNLFTRPRRFGKTLTMSMLDYFFSIDKKEEGARLFTGLTIEKAGPLYMKHQGTYPVIFLTLKDFSDSSWKGMYDSIGIVLQDLYGHFTYLLDSPNLLPEEKAEFQRIFSRQATLADYQMSLKRLSYFLYKHYGVQAIILIDEYDGPLQNAYTEGFYDDAILFWRGWFNAALKDNRALQFAVLTGVLRIA